MTGGNHDPSQLLPPKNKLAGFDIPASAPGVLTVDLGALGRNYAKLCGMVAPAECAAVVKGNGYGPGAGRIGGALLAAGCRTFFVATLGEAVALRGTLTDVTLYVLDGLFPGCAADFAASQIQPVLGSLDEIDEWAGFCRERKARLPAAVHVDTGMNRLGLKAAERRVLVAQPDRLSGFPISLLMSHLACADMPEHPKNAVQQQDFVAFARSMPDMRLSLANSAAIFLGPDFHFDLVRPGIALYGGNPFSALPNPMEPVAGLHGRIVQIGEAEAGETIGYGAALRLTRRTHYIAVSTGYADGYFRLLGSSNAQPGALAYIGDWALPILGRVSMDLIIFDITDIPPGLAQRGGFVELIGSRFTVDNAAALAGTISYEILTSLGSRYHRIYISETDETPLNGGSG